MEARAARRPLYAAGLTVLLTGALAACGSQSGGPSPVAASTTPLSAIRLAAQTSDNATSFTGTMSLRATAKSGASSSGDTSLTASFAEQLHPSLLAQVNVQGLSAAGSALPGDLTEILTPKTMYLKWAYLTQLLHTRQPWLAIPLSTLGTSTGINLGQIFSQASSSSPLSEAQLLGGATSVRKVGTGTVGGVAVTEYTGTLSLDKGIKYLSASDRGAAQKAFATAGLSTATFTVWIDGKNTVRKAIISENGTAVSETTTITITSINQPVSVAIPAAGETSALPGGDFSSVTAQQ